MEKYSQYAKDFKTFESSYIRSRYFTRSCVHYHLPSSGLHSLLKEASMLSFNYKFACTLLQACAITNPLINVVCTYRKVLQLHLNGIVF